jgi:transposase
VPMSGDRPSRRFDVVAETRRRWSKAEKRAIVAEASAPCTNVSAVARRHGISPSLLFRWIKVHAPSHDDRGRSAEPTFLPVALPAPVAVKPAVAEARRSERVTKPSRETARVDATRIEIELANGRQVRVGAGVDAATLKQIIDLLEV